MDRIAVGRAHRVLPWGARAMIIGLIVLALVLRTWMGLLLLGGYYLALRRLTPRGKVVPEEVEDEVQRELDSELLEDLVVDGLFVARAGVIKRLAEEVKLKFGGTPKLTDANRLVAARYILDVMESNGITRKVDQCKLMYKVRALVFTRLAHEREESQWLNSAAACASHDDGAGWLHLTVEWWGWFLKGFGLTGRDE